MLAREDEEAAVGGAGWTSSSSSSSVNRLLRAEWARCMRCTVLAASLAVRNIAAARASEKAP